MKRLICLLALFPLLAQADDFRMLAPLPAPAQETLRQEMRDNLIALNEILSLLATDKLSEAAKVAEEGLGRSAMGKNARLPFEARPGPQMPREMHALGMAGHQAASDFAEAAAKGNRQAAMQHLSALTGTCVACHASYRIR
ncbi:MAG: cytochrome C [Azonexus sp.]|nr:cytochrome C [Azonexus sp.]